MPEEEVVAAEGSVSEGTPVEVETNDQTASPEVEAGTEAAGSSAEEPFLYDVVVDGKTEKVTFEEMQKGYMRQADYTRKTQSVAQQREELAQWGQLAKALETNPQQTVTALAAALGVTVGQAAQAFQPEAGDEDDPIARLERGVNSLTQQFTAQQQAALNARAEQTKQAQAAAQLQADLARLHEQYGDFPDEELAQYAINHGIMNLDHAAKAWRYDAVMAQQAAERNAATEAKRKSQVVAGGSNPQASTVGAAALPKKPSFREAWAAAKEAESR